MSLQDLAQKIQETSAALKRSQSLLAERPDDFLLTLDVASLEKRQAALQEQFVVAAQEAGVNVLQYRVFEENDSPILVRAVAGALETFQATYSVLFDAIKSGLAKTRARLSLQALEESSFGFAYAFTGSVGFALTLPREHLLLGEHIYDQTIEALIRTVRVSSPEELKEIAHTYGVATVRAVYKWADTLASNGLGTELDWTLGQERYGLVLQRPELANLRNVIGLTSESETRVVHVRGTLFAIDTQRRTFGLVLPTGETWRGGLSDRINYEVRVPADYDFEVEVSKTIRYSTEEEDVRYILLAVD